MAKNFELQSLCKKRSKEAKPKNEMRWCAGALVRWCAGALVRWCAGALNKERGTSYKKHLKELKSD
jgi:hypothetical protein